jgi:type VI secretion system secreted protein VgrG
VKCDLGSITMEAMQAITLKVGQSSVKIDQMGVTISGMMIKVNGTVMTEVKGLMTTVKGDAMLQLSGGIIMIG